MSQSAAENVKLVGGKRCIDFVNTASNRHGDVLRSHLEDYADLITWGRHAEVISVEQAEQLLEEARQHEDVARATFNEAIELREALYGVFYAQAQNVPPPSADLETVNTALAVAMAHAQLIPTADGYIWNWRKDTLALDQILWPIVRSAAELLTSGELGLVHECEGDDCGWLFVDTSKNHRRRWCSMDDCGNSAKVRKFRSKQKAA
jgi:predicted RNA-binding Zn ribbon-like protein